METNVQLSDKVALLLAVSKDVIIILKTGDYESLQKNKAIFDRFCGRHSLRVDIVEVDSSEVDQLKNNTRELEKRFEYLMGADGD